MRRNKIYVIIIFALALVVSLYSSEKKTPFEGKWRHENSFLIFRGENVLLIDGGVYLGRFSYDENEMIMKVYSESEDIERKLDFKYKITSSALELENNQFILVDRLVSSNNDGLNWSIFDLLKYLNIYLPEIEQFSTTQGIFWGPAVFIQWSKYSRVYLQARKTKIEALDAVDQAILNKENAFSWGRFYFESLYDNNLMVIYMLLI